MFSKNEYLNIIREHPELSKFFIEYTDIFALKELKNCNIKDKKLFELYYDLCMAKQHEMINDEAYKEIDLISLMEVLSYILPIQFYSKIDNNDEYTNLCFIFANIMSIKGYLDFIFLLKIQHWKTILLTILSIMLLIRILLIILKSIHIRPLKVFLLLQNLRKK